MEEPGGLQSTGSHRVRHDGVTHNNLQMCPEYAKLPLRPASCSARETDTHSHDHEHTCGTRLWGLGDSDTPWGMRRNIRARPRKAPKEASSQSGWGRQRREKMPQEDNGSRPRQAVGPLRGHLSVWSMALSLREPRDVQRGRLGSPCERPQHLSALLSSHQLTMSCTSGDPSLWTSCAGG